MLTAYTKIFALGQSYISHIFDDEVEITEKIDGSQIAFGIIQGELHIRSKGAYIHDYLTRKENDLFYPAIQSILKARTYLVEGWTYYGETLKKPKHNVLAYSTVPKGNIALYGIKFSDGSFAYNLDFFAKLLSMDTVPVLYQGRATPDKVLELMDTVSILGGQKIEGVVVKNYNKPVVIGGHVSSITVGKYVSEAFKEVHASSWKEENTGKGKWDLYKQNFRTPARWNKAIQHLTEKGELTSSPKDIGSLIKEVKEDISQEEKENIKEFLWKEFGDEVLRESVKGLPEWYKDKLLTGE